MSHYPHEEGIGIQLLIHLIDGRLSSVIPNTSSEGGNGSAVVVMGRSSPFRAVIASSHLVAIA
jgi:hypothetical protein